MGQERLDETMKLIGHAMAEGRDLNQLFMEKVKTKALHHRILQANHPKLHFKVLIFEPSDFLRVSLDSSIDPFP